MIPESNPLQRFFKEVVERNYGDVGVRSAEVHDYVANLLTEFCEAETLYKIKNADGRQLCDLGEMLLESDPIYGPAPSFDRERQVRKHIGDYSLFFTGMFPQGLNQYRLRRTRMESLIDFVKAGKESYYIVSKFEHFEYARSCRCLVNSKESEQPVMARMTSRKSLKKCSIPSPGRPMNF